jgi:hypothetical protein
VFLSGASGSLDTWDCGEGPKGYMERWCARGGVVKESEIVWTGNGTLDTQYMNGAHKVGGIQNEG